MADMLNFINPALRSGSEIEFWVGIKLGEGKAHQIRSLLVDIDGKIFGFDLRIKIEMPDTSPRGVCTLTSGSDKPESCPYITNGNRLEIERVEAKSKIVIYRGDRAYTIVEYTGRPRVGIWPKGATVTEEHGEPYPLEEENE